MRPVICNLTVVSEWAPVSGISIATKAAFSIRAGCYKDKEPNTIVRIIVQNRVPARYKRGTSSASDRTVVRA